MNSKVITKPVATAPMEMRLLTVLLRNVKSVITATDSSGRNKISQGKFSYFIFYQPQIFIDETQILSADGADFRRFIPSRLNLRTSAKSAESLRTATILSVFNPCFICG